MTSAERYAIIRALLAKAPKMTAAEIERQRSSFAYGNVKIDEPHVTRLPDRTRR
jgi:hypothetical protein